VTSVEHLGPGRRDLLARGKYRHLWADVCTRSSGSQSSRAINVFYRPMTANSTLLCASGAMPRHATMLGACIRWAGAPALKYFTEEPEQIYVQGKALVFVI